MNKMLIILAAIAGGAGAMYLLDPDRGKRRRALIRDKAVGISNDLRHSFERTATDLNNRMHGVVHEAKKALAPGERGNQIH